MKRNNLAAVHCKTFSFSLFLSLVRWVTPWHFVRSTHLLHLVYTYSMHRRTRARPLMNRCTIATCHEEMSAYLMRMRHSRAIARPLRVLCKSVHSSWIADLLWSCIRARIERYNRVNVWIGLSFDNPLINWLKFLMRREILYKNPNSVTWSEKWKELFLTDDVKSWRSDI